MSTIISLGTPNLDWDVLARTVERTGLPIWLELNGSVHGVLLPVADAQRLMGRYALAAEDLLEASTKAPHTASWDNPVSDAS